MGTRAASATLTLRAKENLVRILFGVVPQTGPSNSTIKCVPDHSTFTYSDLRLAYLDRIQKLHPDKQKSSQLQHGRLGISDRIEKTHRAQSAASPFVELLHAWNRYEAVTRDSKRLSKSDRKDDVDANFTMFGVGCSFADTDEEREQRNRIMDQASRGWLSNGEIGYVDSTSTFCGTHSNGAMTSSGGRHVSLLCDALFQTQQDGDELNNDTTVHINRGDKVNVPSTPIQRSLVSHLVPPHKRQ